MSDARLAGKVALVTGTSPNIGGVLAAGLASYGAKVACNDIRGDFVDTCVARIVADGGEAMGAAGDVTDPDAMKAAVDAVVDRWGRIDVLVNNAVKFDTRGLLDMPLDAFRKQIDISITGTFIVSSLVAKSMIERGIGGSIINVLSTAAWQGQAGNIGYCTAKSGLINFSRQPRWNWRPTAFASTASRPRPPRPMTPTWPAASTWPSPPLGTPTPWTSLVATRGTVSRPQRTTWRPWSFWRQMIRP